MTKKKVLIGCTGSVAAIKIPEIVQIFETYQDTIEVKVVCTSNALRFFDTNALNVPVLTDEDEWQAWSKRGDPVLHIELRKWADVMLIAPLDANTLAKIANGLCDNLLTCVVRAWDAKKPLLFAPAMNTMMWEQTITSMQIERLKYFKYFEIPCIAKKLICGDTGMGAMAEVSTIVNKVLEVLQISKGDSESTTTSTSEKTSLD